MLSRKTLTSTDTQSEVLSPAGEAVLGETYTASLSQASELCAPVEMTRELAADNVRSASGAMLDFLAVFGLYIYTLAESLS